MPGTSEPAADLKESGEPPGRVISSVRSGQVGEWFKPTDCKSVPPCEVRRFESFPVHHVFPIICSLRTGRIVRAGMNIDERLEFLVRSTESLHASAQELHAIVAEHTRQLEQ